MIVLRARDNGQLLAAVIGPRSVRCTPDPQRAMSFSSDDEARAFLLASGLGKFFERVPRERATAPLPSKGKRPRAD